MASDDQLGRILVVDDTPASVRLLADVLTAQGYECWSAPSGEAALELVASCRPDLVLLDLFMPGLDGLEVCRRIRRDDEAGYLPVIMLTAAGDEKRVHALDAGADDFLSKPIDHAELVARVRSLIRIRRYHDRIEAQAQELAELNAGLESRVADQVEELARLSRLRRFLPGAIADLVTSADEEWLLDTHRSEVAVLFVDLRDFTSFAHLAEPEDVIQVLRQFHGAVGGCVDRFGATVGGLAGDGLMAFLNDPVPHPDPARSVVDMALEIQREAEAVLDRWRGEGYSLGVGIGVAMGYATLGILGVGERIDYSPIGSVVNLASRLCSQARAGEILINQSIHAALGDAVDCDATEPLELHGFPAPVRAWRLQSEAAARLRPGPDRPAPVVAPATALPSAAPPPEENAFLREGDDWTISFAARTIRMRDSKGLRYIARLMSRPGREVHVGELVGLSDRESAALGAATGPVLDREARAAYEKRLSDLEAERDEAQEWGDLERAARAEAEMQFLTAELAASLGLGGRGRRFDDPTERMRKAVTNRIRAAVAKADHVHPELGRHLSHSLRTGTFCAYEPERPVEWKL